MDRYNKNASHRLRRYHRWIDTIEMQATDYPDKHRWIDSMEMQAKDYPDKHRWIDTMEMQATDYTDITDG
jgi:hypothetical protein